VTLELREATVDDEVALRLFLGSQGLPADDILSPGTTYWVVQTASKDVIASVGLEFGGEAGLLRSVATAEAHRRKGLGKKLVQKALEKARSHHLSHVYLFSTGAGSYFSSLGFVESPVEELVTALPKAPQVLRFASLGWLATEVAWRIDL
jgi:amino-acid N-acetyltransferase